MINLSYHFKNTENGRKKINNVNKAILAYEKKNIVVKGNDYIPIK